MVLTTPPRGGRLGCEVYCFAIVILQSTPPREETSIRHDFSTQKYFNPLLREEGDFWGSVQLRGQTKFSIHSLREEGDSKP